MSEMTDNPTPVPAIHPWNPWKEWCEVYWPQRWSLVLCHELPDRYFGLTSPAEKTVWLCRKLGPVNRTMTLAHELLHIELNVFEGPGVQRTIEYLEGERLVVEMTARRMIPFKALADVVMTRPNATFDAWVTLLRVNRAVLRDRFITLTPVEQATLTQLRGGPLPVMPHNTLWDEGPDAALGDKAVEVAACGSAVCRQPDETAISGIISSLRVQP